MLKLRIGMGLLATAWYSVPQTLSMMPDKLKLSFRILKFQSSLV